MNWWVGGGMYGQKEELMEGGGIYGQMNGLVDGWRDLWAEGRFDR